MKIIHWNEENTALAEGRKYSSRGKFAKGNRGAYIYCLKHKLLELLFPFTPKPAYDLLDNIKLGAV